jgi:UDP-N-acetylmuramyl tripeptide synthase
LEILDSRRLTGPSLVQFKPGAIINVALAQGESADTVVAAWERHARAALEAVGWGSEQTSHHVFASGLSLAHSAPVDALYAATEVNEWAFEQARRELAGEPLEPAEEAAPRLVAEIEAERNERIVELTAASYSHGVTCLRDDDRLSLGLGCGSITWDVKELPTAGEVAWDCLHDVPVALVTGTNGKSTTVRMLAAIAECAGFTVGTSSTDRLLVGDRCLDTGDWSGPGGARRILRDPDVELAILETARGGLLRRGLALERAQVGIVTNVAADHLGEWGVGDVGELADAKLVVSRAAEHLVLNADDPVLVEHAASCVRPVTWFSLRGSQVDVASLRDDGGRLVLLEGDDLVLHEGAAVSKVVPVSEVPATLGGAARFNISNALAAIGAARELGLTVERIGEGLRSFRSDSEDNPGRLNLFEIDGVRVLVDFAHNPHGMQALLDMAKTMKPERLLVSTGQAGDRDDESIRELARVVAGARPDHVIVKPMAVYLRGRPEGEIPAMLEAEFVSSGQARGTIEHAADEIDAARRALTWARPGDLLLLTCHAQRDELVAFLQARLPS